MKIFSLQINFNTVLLGLTVVVVLFLSFFGSVEAQINPQINYQGKLTNNSGVAVPNGTYNMRFWLIDSSTAATTSAQWSEELTGASKVQVTNGLFSVMLGSSSALSSVDFNQTLYLGVEIGGTSTPAWDGEMSPRKILGTVPAAFVANYAEVAGSASSSDNASALSGLATTSFLRSDIADTMEATSSSPILSIIQNGAGAVARLFSGVTEVFTVLNNGNVGVGTSTPGSLLTVAGNTSIVGNLTATGITTLTNASTSNLSLSGRLYDGDSLSGTAGMILQTTGTSTRWVATSSLGITGGASALASLTDTNIVAPATGEILSYDGTDWVNVATSTLGFGDGTFLSLSDTPSSYTANRLMYTNSGATGLVDSANLTFDGTQLAVNGDVRSGYFVASSTTGTSTFAGRVGIGTTTPEALLSLMGTTGGTSPLLQISSSTGATLLALLADGSLDIGDGGVYYDPDNRKTSIENLSLGAVNFAVDGGTVSLVDMLIELAATNTVMSYSAQIDSNPILTIYGESNGMGGAQNLRVGIGTTSPSSQLTIQSTPGANPFLIASSSGDIFLSLNQAGNLSLGTSVGDSKLTIQGTAGLANTLTIASSTGSTTLALLANGDLELPGQLVSAGIQWTPRSAAGDNDDWTGITYGNGLFVAVGADLTGDNVVKTSPDGINWTPRSAAGDNDYWTSVTYGNGLFVASGAGYGGGAFMTSPDGINWTVRNAAGDDDYLTSVTYGNGLFVAVGVTGDQLLTSPDGINWTARSAAGNNDQWHSVTYGNGKFVAVGNLPDLVMSSSDGITWATTSTAGDDDDWSSVTYGNGKFVAVASNGTDRVMTSSDGITWATTSAAGDDDAWTYVTYGNGLFVAISDTNDIVMTSPDGINWTVRTASEANNWNSIAYGNGVFVAVSDDGANRVMTSGKMGDSQLATNNIFQGGTNFMGGLRAGTTSSDVASVFLQSQAGINPFAIASSTGETLFSILQNGNVGIGTTTQTSLLGMQKTGITGTTTAGLDQYFAFSNGTASALQYGNRSRLVTTNTATTTLVGNFLTITDSTTYGNTVRGLEVQSDLGSNTRGENTAISGYARTFGVRGITSGDAGVNFEPAGVYGETTGTTEGNAIRGYSSTITTAALLKLFQNSSTFTGTGLLMNFGNSGGSFSSTTASRFIDLQNAGTSRFTVGAYGMLTIGDGTTGQNAGIQIGYGGLCVDSDGTCSASTTGHINSVSSATGNSDLAEMYFSDEDLVAGEVVYQKGGLSVGRASDETSDLVLGVVSTLPGLIMGFNDESLEEGEEAHPIALSGRVPVKLSTENGEIKIGDELMLSSIPGVAMKASSTGTVIGIALEDFEDTRAYSETFVNQFGESIIVPNFVPINRVNDPRINDGCYYGAGSATGDKPCVPLKAKTPKGQYDEADTLAAEEAKAIALAELEATPSEVIDLPDGTEVKVGQIVMFVNLGRRYLDGRGMDMVAALISVASSTDSEVSTETIWERLVKLANNFVDGVLSVLTLKAEKVETQELCVDGVCVNADDLQKLLDNYIDTNNESVDDDETSNDNDETLGGEDADEENDNSSSTTPVIPEDEPVDEEPSEETPEGPVEDSPLGPTNDENELENNSDFTSEDLESTDPEQEPANVVEPTV